MGSAFKWKWSMASEAPGDQEKVPKPVLGMILGIVCVYVVVSRTVNEVVGSELPWRVASILTGVLVGGGVGGLIQLRIRGQAADIPRFLRHFFLSLLKMFFLLWAPMLLAGWLGDRLYGSVGHDIGLVAGAVLTLPVWFWFLARSSREKPSAPASGPSGEGPAAGKAKGSV